MTITATSKLGLTKDDGTENYSVTRVNANTDKLDAAAGAQICTSATRPSSPFTGQEAYETDTSAHIVCTNATGPVWKYVTNPTVANSTALAALTPVHQGLMAFTTDLLVTWRRGSGGWIAVQALFMCELRQTVAQTIGNNVTSPWTALSFTTEDSDSHNGHSTVTNNSRYVFPISGKYRISGAVGWAVNSSGARGTMWRVNNTDFTASQILVPANGTAVGTHIPARTKTINVNAGDYLELAVYQNSGGNLDTSAGSGDQAGITIEYVGTYQ